MSRRHRPPPGDPRQSPAPTAGGIAAQLDAALALHQQGQLQRAEVLYQQILERQPENFDALRLLAIASGQQGRADVALKLFDRALAVRPADAATHADRANALLTLGRLPEALAGCARALALEPGNVEALYNEGVALQGLARLPEALASYERTLAIQPAFPEAHFQRGNVLKGLGRTADALASFERALTLRPDYAEALTHRGHALLDLGRPLEALSSYGRAVALRPDLADALNGQCAALIALKRPAEGLAASDRALALRPDDARALNNRGVALDNLGRFEESLAAFRRALELRPGYAEARNSEASCLLALRRPVEALASYAQALAIRPDYPLLLGNWLHTKMKLCDWTDLDRAFETLVGTIASGRPAASPFAVMAAPLTPAEQRRCAEVFVEHHFPPGRPRPAARPATTGDRIRVGYFSADFGDHPVAHLTAGLFETHDRRRFAVLGFCLGPPGQDAMRVRLDRAFDRFIDVSGKTDEQIVELARAEGLDIAVDLMGFTRHARTGIFAERAAPLQVNYLGYPGTLGAGYMDYLVADQTIIPAEHAQYYREKIVYLPDSFQVNDAKRPISATTPGRAALGLPEQGFVFCNFNSSYKLNPEDFDLWMRVLQKVPGSVLWLAGAHPAAVANLRREASARGVAPERLVFKAYTAALADHLAELRQADLFLDSRYFNAHTTGSDALWAGVPLLTRPGDTYASRVAASLLKAVGLPELITTSAAAYEALALDLATDASRLATLKQRLAANRLTAPLFDTARTTRQLEAAFITMVERHRAGLPPDHIVVPA